MKTLITLAAIGFIFFVSIAQTPTQKKQSKARAEKRVEARVYISNSRSAYAYHSSMCRGLNRCTHEVTRMKVSEAKNMGYSACKICY